MTDAELAQWTDDLGTAHLSHDAYRFALIMRAVGRDAPFGRSETHHLISLALGISQEEVILAETEARRDGWFR